MSGLHALARLAGLQPEWQDAAGRAQTVADDALRTILAALGLPAADDAAVAESIAAAEAERAAPRTFVSADAGTPFTIAGVDGPAVLRFEDGGARDILVDSGRMPAIDRTGYHVLEIGDRRIGVAIAPERCFSVEDRVAGKRLWGPAVQIPSLRDAGPNDFGDFGSLAAAASHFAEAGADLIAISPTHALFPSDPHRFSPYAPSSRQFVNVMLASTDMVDRPEGASDDDLIDWVSASPVKLNALRHAFDTLSAQSRADLAAFRAAGGEALSWHAAYDAIHAHFFAATGARGWQDWPEAFHDCGSDAVARFIDEHCTDCDFHVFLQWRAVTGLAAAQKAAIDGGMALGLIADLAVGMDAGGSHGWSRGGDLLTGLSIGAPPDPLGPDGQAWGITGFDPRALVRSGFAPFIATIRAALTHAGGLRIDHAFGLRRLWVVPDGGSAAEGAYLDMPFADLMRIIAIESHRAQAVVIGEDLGTMPDGFRAVMDARAMLGMRVLWFERGADGAFVRPDRWSRDAVAMTGTHDLPTIAGWWRGRDIDWTWRLGRSAEAADEAADRANRALDRSRLWTALGAEGPEPAPEDPAAVIDAAIAHVARTPCALAIIPFEDLLGLVEQPNLPGTTDEHPNWRRRMPDTVDVLLRHPDTARRVALLNTARPS
jgi:4-alpha-glucanotransferase